MTMHRCDICKKLKFYRMIVKISVQTYKYEEKHKDVCYSCLDMLGFKIPHKGD